MAPVWPSLGPRNPIRSQRSQAKDKRRGKVIFALLLQASNPPSNLSFLLAAFIITGVTFLGYGLFILRRKQESLKEIERLRSDPENDADPRP